MRKWRRRTAGGIHNLTLLGESPSLLPPLLLSLSLSHTHTPISISLLFFHPLLSSAQDKCALLPSLLQHSGTSPKTSTFVHTKLPLTHSTSAQTFPPTFQQQIKVDLSLLFREKGPPLNCRHQFPSPLFVRYNPLCKFANWTRQEGGFSLVSENRGEINGRICYSSFSSFPSLMIPASEQRKRNH